MSQRKQSVVGGVALAICVVVLLGTAAGVIGVLKGTAERDLHKAVYNPPSIEEIAAKQAQAAAEVADMPEGKEKARDQARAERKLGVKSWENWWKGLGDQGQTIASLGVLCLIALILLNVFKPRRGW